MCGHDQGGAPLLLLAEEMAHVGRGHRVEPRSRLVAEDPVGIMQRRPNQRHLLRHAARVRGEDRVAAVGQLETLEERGDARTPFCFRNPIQVAEPIEVLRRRVATVEPRLVGHDAKPRPHRVQAFGQAQAVKLDRPGVRSQDPAEAAQRRRLARPVLAEQDQDLAALNVQVDPGHGAHVAEALA